MQPLLSAQPACFQPYPSGSAHPSDQRLFQKISKVIGEIAFGIRRRSDALGGGETQWSSTGDWALCAPPSPGMPSYHRARCGAILTHLCAFSGQAGEWRRGGDGDYSDDGEEIGGLLNRGFDP
jgi:hypothetical protein